MLTTQQNTLTSQSNYVQLCNLEIGLPILEYLARPKKKKKHLLTSQSWIQIVDYKVKRKSHTLYLIKVRNQHCIWQFWTRYSMLLEFYTQIDPDLRAELPSFPQKRIFRNLSKEVIQERSILLNDFLQFLFQNKIIKRSQIFKNFINQSQQRAQCLIDLDILDKFTLDI